MGDLRRVSTLKTCEKDGDHRRLGETGVGGYKVGNVRSSPRLGRHSFAVPGSSTASQAATSNSDNSCSNGRVNFVI